MLDWFEAKAPIRVKFTVLLYVLIGQCLLEIASTLLAVGGLLPGYVVIAADLATAVMIALVVLIAKERICRPYVETVVRMEALAAGDTQSPFPYTHHTDCVGRMTAAMETFRDNAVNLESQSAQQIEIVDALSGALKGLAQKRLDTRLDEAFPVHYESLRADYNRALEALGEAISAVSQTAEMVLTGASEIHTATGDLSHRNENQAASLEEASAAMDQVTQSVNEAAKAALTARELIESAQNTAQEGDSVVDKAVQAMGQIEQSASEIAKIVDVIDAIAFQTNLLALNAGVEAARAGNAGKGFAVVANEVRALAQRSADAARDIGDLIRASSEHVASGVALVNDTGTLLSQIVQRIRAVNDEVSAIAENAQNQAETLMQVNSTVSDLDRVTQQNAAMVEQASAATRSLSGEARELREVVRSFALRGPRPGTPVKISALPAPSTPPSAMIRRQSSGGKALSQGALALAIQPDVAMEDWAEF